MEKGGSVSNLLMVGGADTWLDHLSGYSNEVTLTISEDDELPNKLKMIKGNGHGRTYVAEQSDGKLKDHEVWLCPVTEFIFDGYYPKTIYYQIKNDGKH